MKKRFTQLLLGLLLLNIFTIEAQQVTSNQALETARNFLGNRPSAQKAKNMNGASASSMKLAYIGGDFGRPDFYIYNVGEDEGFVIVSADERAHAILGYATEGSFNLTTTDAAFMAALDKYSEQVQALRSIEVEVEVPLLVRKKADAQTVEEIYKIALLDTVTMAVTAPDGTEKILKGIKYDQLAPYNDQCPEIKGVKAYTGCGATAMVQVMRYHRYPESGTGSNNGIDFSKAQYRWDLMLPNYTNNKKNANYGSEESREAVALAMYHAGRSVNMIYSTDGSGTGSRTVANGLSTYFKYNKNMNLAHHLIYTDDEWYQTIKAEIDAGRPVIYSGTRIGGYSHLFVCDGYDSEGRLHYNYGWSGTGNAYLYPTVDPSGNGQINRYFMDDDAIIGIGKDESDVRPQIALLSPLHVSNFTPSVGTTFNVSCRISNYGRNAFNDWVQLALCDPATGTVKQLLKMGTADHISVNAPHNNIDAGSDAIRSQNIKFTGVKITAIADGTYELRCFARSTKYPILARTGDVQRSIKVVKKNKAFTFSYESGAGQLPLETVVNSAKIVVASGIGKANFKLINPNARKDFSGKIFIIGYKDATATMELFGTKEINVAHKDTIDIEMGGMHMSSGSYTCYVAYNPIDNAEGTWLGAVPIVASKMEYTYEEKSGDFDVNLYNLKALPDGFRQYNDETEFILSEDNVLSAAWTYYESPMFKATSRFLKATQANSHIMVTTPIHVANANDVLEWSVNLMGSSVDNPHLLSVYVSDKGNDISNFTEENCISKDSLFATVSEDQVLRTSLYQYAGKDVYVAFKHVRYDSEQISALWLKRIRQLNVSSPKDIALKKVEVVNRCLSGDSLPIKITVVNQASLPITAFTAKYKVGDINYEETFTSKGLGYDIPTEFTLTKATAVGTAGDVLNVSVTLVLEGEDGSFMDNNSGSAKVTVMSYHPRKTMVVYKVSRGGCGACSASYTKLDWLEEDYPSSFAGVEIWEPYNGQPTYPQYGCSDFSDFYSFSTPSVNMNNKGVAFQNIDQIDTNIANQCLAFQPVSEVKAQAAYADAQSRTLNIKLTGNFALPMTGTYKMGIFVIESNVLAPNFQISGASLVSGGHTKNHMPIAAPQGAKGADSPYTIINPVIGQDYTFEFTYDVPEMHGEEEGGIRNVNRDNIQVIGVMFRPDGTIDASSLNSYYVKIPVRGGLTFISENGYDSFKNIWEVQETGRVKNQFISSQRSRATVPAGNDFRFRVAKADSLGNRKVRLIVRKSEESVAEQLVPDADGIYTLKNVNRYYFIDTEVLNVEEPTITRKGTELVLNGSWDGADFRRIDMSDESVTGIDMSAITIPLDAGQLTPANPNCLIYVAAGSLIPASWKNVVVGEEAETINLMDGYAFCNSRNFRAGTISYTRDYPQPGWSSLCLPFALNELPDGISLKSYTACTGSEVRFSQLNTPAAANTPYMAEITTTGSKTFVAHAVNVEMSEVNRDIKYSDFAYKGTFTSFAKGEAEGLYILNSDGSGFLKGGPKTTIPAFRAYLRNEGPDNTILRVRVNHADPTAMEYGQCQGGFHVYSTNGKLVIITEENMQLDLTSSDGIVIRRMDLNIGENIVEGLMPGFYLLGNKKVCIQ